MKGVHSFIKSKETLTVVIATVVGVMAITGLVSASTTISTDITTAGNVYASSTVQADGALIGRSTLAMTGAATLSSTLGVTGLSTLTAGFVSQASSTVVGAFTVTGAVTHTGTVQTGSSGTAISNLVTGFCTASVAVNASTSAYVACTGAGTGVTASDRVFIMGTSTLPDRVSVIAASTTASAGTIELQVFNNGIDAGNLSSTPVSFNFLAIH